MTSLAQVMCSAARVRVLETLAHRPDGFHLRELAELSGTPLRSVQLASKGLVRRGCVTQQRDGNRLLFRLNRRSADYGLIVTVLEASAEFHLRQRAARLTRRAQQTIAFADSARKLLTVARANTRPSSSGGGTTVAP